MKKINIIILILIMFILQGCTPPPISILYLTDKKYYEHIIEIDKTVYFLEEEYSLNKFSERINKNDITYVNITTQKDEEYTFDKISLKDSSLICKSKMKEEAFNIRHIKYIQLYRASTKEEKQEGWIQVFCWSLIGLLGDVTNSKDGKTTFYGTAIGATVGLSLGSLFFFDKNKVSEKIYIKK